MALRQGFAKGRETRVGWFWKRTGIPGLLTHLKGIADVCLTWVWEKVEPTGFCQLCSYDDVGGPRLLRLTETALMKTNSASQIYLYSR